MIKLASTSTAFQFLSFEGVASMQTFLSILTGKVRSNIISTEKKWRRGIDRFKPEDQVGARGQPQLEIDLEGMSAYKLGKCVLY